MALHNARKAFLYLLIPAILLVFVFSFLSTRDSTDLRYPPHAPPSSAFLLPSAQDNSEIASVDKLLKKNDQIDLQHSTVSTINTENQATFSSDKDHENFKKIKPIIQIDTEKLYPTLELTPLENQTNPWTEKLAQRFRTISPTQPLKVIIVPHSHNDPGWLNTYDQYYTHYTNAILDSTVKNLALYPNMTFVWSEMSFLSRWLDQQHSKTKAKFKKFIQEGRLEITTGGWVMTDEGPAHFYDMIEELVEGHQFLKNSLGITSKNSWSVDPFGHGATFPYLLQKSGIENMYIQRTHFAWKRYLAETQQLEFFWRQRFENENSNQLKPIVCHMSPLELYSYKYACGPNYKVCLNFDFRRIYGENSESTAVSLNKQNIHNKSLEILDQYQKLGSMFSHNVALVLLGDDFRYNYDIEWKQQYENYEFLMKYINDNSDRYFNGTTIKFGTLNDYFQDVFERQPRDIEKNFPNLIGDFMPYADVYVNQFPNYWTGYFSTRPFLKSLSRQLQQQLRSTEILYTLARQYVKQSYNSRIKLDQEYRKLSEARQNLALFQHHDGITGTSKEYVMADYGARMSRSFHQMRNLAGYSLQNIALDHEYSGLFVYSILNSINEKRHWNHLEESKIFKVPPGEQGLQILVFNSNLQERFEKVRFQIEDPFVRLVDAETGERIHFQINPVFESLNTFSSSTFELEFGTILQPLCLKNFRVITDEDSIREKVTIIQYDESENAENQVDQSSEVFQFEKQKNIFIENHQYRIDFDSQGLMKEILFKYTGIKHKFLIDFLTYKTVPVLSGAYLFKPQKNIPEKFLNYSTVNIVQVNGKQSTSLFVNFTDLAYSLTLHHDDKKSSQISHAIDLRILVDIGKKSYYNDREIVLRIDTDIHNRIVDGYRVFSTDSNGFQMLQRRYISRVGVEANYYPMTTGMFIEDVNHMRVTLLTSTSLGSTSPQSGSLEVMLERKTIADDRRGLSQGVLDNLKTELMFTLVLEKTLPDEPHVLDLTSLSNSLLLQFNYPAAVYALEDITILQQENNINNEFKLQNRQFLPSGALCESFLINLRTLPIYGHFNIPSNSSLLLLNKRNIICQNKTLDKNGLHLLNDLHIQSIKETSLTGIKTLKNILNLDELDRDVSHIAAFNVTFT